MKAHVETTLGVVPSVQSLKTMKTNYMEYTRKYDKCLRFAPISKAYPEELTSMISPWSFAVWGIDLIGRLPK